MLSGYQPRVDKNWWIMHVKSKYFITYHALEELTLFPVYFVQHALKKEWLKLRKKQITTLMVLQCLQLPVFPAQ